MTPVRVGLTPTCSSTRSEPGAMLAPTKKNAAEEISAGTSISVPFNRPPPVTATVRSPSRRSG